jgi:hypothetical protein
MDGTTGEAAAQKAAAKLETIKEKYIDIYFEEHKKKRLGIDDEMRREKLKGSRTIENLRKLREIEILSTVKFSELEKEIADLKPCYDLTPSTLRLTPFCPHCRYRPGDKDKNVYGQLDHLEKRMYDMVSEWTKTLLDTISDPIVKNQETFLKAQEAQVIDEFVYSGKLPEKVDDVFVGSIHALLKGLEPVVIDTGELVRKLEELPPMDEASFKVKINEIVAAYIKGKDTNKLRIIIKRRGGEDGSN